MNHTRNFPHSYGACYTVIIKALIMLSQKPPSSPFWSGPPQPHENEELPKVVFFPCESRRNSTENSRSIKKHPPPSSSFFLNAKIAPRPPADASNFFPEIPRTQSAQKKRKGIMHKQYIYRIGDRKKFLFNLSECTVGIKKYNRVLQNRISLEQVQNIF